MIEIIPGICRLEVPIPNNPLGHTNTYLIQEDNDYFLIDPGINTEEAFESLKKELGEAGVSVEAITQIFVTHSHADHYGLAPRVKQLSQAKIIIHHLAYDLIQSMFANPERAQQMEQWLRLNGMPSLDPSQMRMAMPGIPRTSAPIIPDVTLQGGETLSIGKLAFKVLWTPGHARDHLCLYEPTLKILFSGDHVLPVITPHVSLQFQSNTNPLGDFFDSLNAVKELDVNLVLPAHESPFTGLKRRVSELFEHHERRNSEILATLKAEPQTAYQVSNGITWMPETGGVHFQNLAPWDKRMAVMEALAHLEALRIEGKIDTLPRDGVIYYHLT